MGISFFLNPTSLNIKIAFASILIGLFMIFMITEKTIPKNLSNAQMEGDINIAEKLISQMNLEGNAIFLPKSDTLSEERIFIPPNRLGLIKIPNIADNNIILKGKDNVNYGLSVPPSGLKLLEKIEKNIDFENTNFKSLEEKLQIFVGMDLLKSISFKKNKNGWRLEIDKPMFCNNGQSLHMQYPCPTCSAVITAITRSFNKKIRIYYVTTHEGQKVTYYLNFIRRKTS
jgi:hypothetical protein